MHSSYPSSLSVCDISAKFGQNAMGSWLIYSSEKSSEINNVFSSDSLRPDLCGFRGYQRSVQTRYETCLPWKQSNIMWHIALYFREEIGVYRHTDSLGRIPPRYPTLCDIITVGARITLN